MLLAMTNQSPTLNDQFKSGNEYKIISEKIGTTTNFRMFYTYSSRTQ